MKKSDADSLHVKKRSDVKNTFLGGVVILTVSNLLVKIAGLLFKIPMNYTIGDAGMGYYNSAYSIYTLLYMLSTSGLPLAISVMVSEKKTEGNVRGAKAVFRMALLIFAAVGLFCCLVMLLFSEELAGVIKSDKSALSVAVAAPTMFFICVSSAYRGYFQGCGNMVPTAVSQLIEALGKLIIGIAAAVYAVGMGFAVHVVAAYAVAGLTIGSILGAFYLALTSFFRGDRDLVDSSVPINSADFRKGDIIKRFLTISIPVTVSASVMSLTNIIDTAMIQRILLSSGISEESAAAMFGNYTSLAVPMFNLPPVLVYPIAYSLVPVVAAAAGEGKIESAREKISLSLRYAVIIGLPCAIGLSVLSDPILCLLYKETSAHTASPMLSCLAPSSMLVCILAVTNSILQGCGKERMPVLSMLAGALVKITSGCFLLHRYGMVGAPVSTFLCYFTVTLLNLYFVTKYTGVALDVKSLAMPLLSSVVCGFTAVFTNNSLVLFCGKRPACVIAIFVAAVIYAAMIVMTGTVKINDIKQMLKKKRKTA